MGTASGVAGTRQAGHTLVALQPNEGTSARCCLIDVTCLGECARFRTKQLRMRAGGICLI